MEENKKPVLIGILVIAALIVVFLLIKNLSASKKNDLATSKLSVTRIERVTPPYYLTNGKTSLNLLPKETKAAVGQTLTFDIVVNNLSDEMVAADLILMFDKNYLEFTGSRVLDTNYVNPRQLVQDQKVILSFVKKVTENSASENAKIAKSMVLGQISFKTLKSGQTEISPLLQASEKSSLIFVKNNSTNQLANTNSVKINIE